jgi:allantoicase
MHSDDLMRLVNLADASLGAEALEATDEFFAAKERMLSRAEPVSRPDTYDDHGQWMDGWETRRRRVHGHDSCIVKLAYPGVIRLADIDTRYFTGNYPPRASIDATGAADPLSSATRWTEILPPSALIGNDHNLFAIADASMWRHLRLNLLPDGGVARLRAYGEVAPDWSAIGDDEVIDLFAIEHGGMALEANDQHYGDIRNLNRPGRGVNMGDGWETRRRREPGFDWVIIRLGHAGDIREIEIDTAHHRGNYPARVSINAALLPAGAGERLAAESMHWPCLMAEQPMRPHAQHRFCGELGRLGPLSHLRVNLHPDGGITRIRVYGTLARR